MKWRLLLKSIPNPSGRANILSPPFNNSFTYELLESE